jgi:hypothetical protein
VAVTWASLDGDYLHLLACHKCFAAWMVAVDVIHGGGHQSAVPQVGVMMISE